MGMNPKKSKDACIIAICIQLHFVFLKFVMAETAPDLGAKTNPMPWPRSFNYITKGNATQKML